MKLALRKELAEIKQQYKLGEHIGVKNRKPQADIQLKATVIDIYLNKMRRGCNFMREIPLNKTKAVVRYFVFPVGQTCTYFWHLFSYFS